jgi:hypothetical protein
MEQNIVELRVRDHRTREGEKKQDGVADLILADDG